MRWCSEGVGLVLDARLVGKQAGTRLLGNCLVGII